MKKNYTVKVFITLLFGVLAGTLAAYAGTPMQNYPIDKSPFYGMNVVVASTFSIEDAESTTDLTTFPLSDVVVYPKSATLKMDAAYKEKSSGFGSGGTEASPYYAVTNVASNITSSFSYGTPDANCLYFHAPKSQGKVLAISTEHKPNTEVYIKTTIALVAGNKTKLELWAGPAGATDRVAEYTFDKGSQKTEWNIGEYFDSFSYPSVVGGSSIVFEIRRGNYNEGADCVFAMEQFSAYGTLDLLKISGTQLSAPIGTPVRLTATYTEPVTQQNLHWFQGETIGGYPYFPEITQYTGQNPIELMPPLGTYYYTVTALGQDDVKIASADTLKVERYLECGSNSKLVWHEDFEKLASEDARNSYQGMQYTYAATGNVDDGMYAVTANPRTCGQDKTPVQKEADYWFRKIYDHTQGGAKGGEYGGMLLVNCRDAATPAGFSDIVLEKIIPAEEIGCENSKVWINFSAWFANADWNRGIGETHPIKMKLRVLSATGGVIGSIDVIAGVEDGWKRGVVSIEYPGGNIVLQIVNYGESGGGNDVLVDDIQFEVCRPTVGLEAETLEGKKYEDIKNVSTPVCGTKVVLIADPTNSFQDIFPIAQGCPYFVWLESEDGENWNRAKVDGSEWEGSGNCPGSAIDYSKYSPATIENQPMYYKAVIGTDSREVEAYLSDPEAHPCSPVVETPAAYVYCSSLKLTLEKESCNTYEAEVENAEAGHTFKWEYGNEYCGWTVIEGQTGSEIKFDAKAYFDKLNNGVTPTSDQEGCCEVGIKVTDTTSGDIAMEYVPEVFVPSLVAELLSQENCASVYQLTASLLDACYGEEMAYSYEFYKDGQKIDRCENEQFAGFDNNPNTYNPAPANDPTYGRPNQSIQCDYDPEYTTEELIGGATYTVKFAGEDDVMFCEATVTLASGCELMWPTIITPYTADNMNDVFAPFYCAVKTEDGKCSNAVDFPVEDIVSIKIFDRTGNMVAETAKAGWDGTSSGKNVVPAVYFYVAVCNIDGQEQSFRGTVEVFNDPNTSKK